MSFFLNCDVIPKLGNEFISDGQKYVAKWYGIISLILLNRINIYAPVRDSWQHFLYFFRNVNPGKSDSIKIFT